MNHVSTSVAKICLIAAAISMLGGCAAASRTIGKITANKFAEPRSGTVWVVPPPQLEPPRPDRRTVYISYRNISDAQDIQLLDTLKRAASNQGWTILNDPSRAAYRLRASLRYFGEVEPESGGRNIANGLGGITGAAVGVASGVALGRATNSGVTGFVGGVAAGGLVAQGMANASRPREWALIMDFVLEEYSDRPVTFTMEQGGGSSTSTGAGTSSARMVDGGGTFGSNSRSGSMTQTSNYFPHGVRLSAWANQMSMTEEEAMPHIIDRTEKVVVQMLPI